MIFFVIFQKVTKITVLYFTSRRRYIAETASTTKVSIFGIYICQCTIRIDAYCICAIFFKTRPCWCIKQRVLNIFLGLHPHPYVVYVISDCADWSVH